MPRTAKVRFRRSTRGGSVATCRGGVIQPIWKSAVVVGAPPNGTMIRTIGPARRITANRGSPRPFRTLMTPIFTRERGRRYASSRRTPRTSVGPRCLSVSASWIPPGTGPKSPCHASDSSMSLKENGRTFIRGNADELYSIVSIFRLEYPERGLWRGGPRVSDNLWELGVGARRLLSSM